MKRSRYCTQAAAGAYKQITLAAAMALLTGALALSLLTASAGALPDNRVYELVSPVESYGNESGIRPGGTEAESAAVLPNGNAVMYATTGPIGLSSSSGLETFVVSRRTASGWHTTDVLPRPRPPVSIKGDPPTGGVSPSPSLTQFAFETSEHPYTAAGTELSPKGKTFSPNLYLISGGQLGEPSWISQPTIEDPSPALGKMDSSYPPAPAAPPADNGRTYFSYYGTLVPEDASRAAHVTEVRVFKEDHNAWGFYEWSEGHLVNAGQLPNGTYDEYGAVPAATVQTGGTLGGPTGQMNDYHQVSEDGQRAYFLSPDPENPVRPESDPVELYLREDGKPALVSKDVLNKGQPAPAASGGTTHASGIVGMHVPQLTSAPKQSSFVYATPNGERAFFESLDKLAKSASGEEPAGAGPWMYEFNATTRSLVFLENINGTIVGSSRDGATLLYVREKSFAADEGELAIWHAGISTKVGELPKPHSQPETYANLVVAPVEGTATGSAFVFETNSAISNAVDIEGEPAANAEGFLEVYRYEAGIGKLVCLSCAPAGSTTAGYAHVTTDEEIAGHEYATARDHVIMSRFMSAEGTRVFFDTPTALVPQDVNGQRDVYEWEAAGTGSCARLSSEGCIYLITTGTSEAPSFSLGTSESGQDEFIATQQALVPEDTNGGYDVYDVRVSTGVEPAATLASCGSCEAATSAATSPSVLTSAAGSSGNLVASKAGRVKRGQRRRASQRALRRALARCAQKYRHKRHRRRLCERRARRRARRGRVAQRRGSHVRHGRARGSDIKRNKHQHKDHGRAGRGK